MKRSLVSFSVIFLLLFTAISAKAADPLAGSWIFNVDYVPWEYSKGTVVIEEDNEARLTGAIEFDSGIKIKINRITQESEKITFEVFVEGYQVKTIVERKEDILKGYAETPDGNMPFSARRHVPEK